MSKKKNITEGDESLDQGTAADGVELTFTDPEQGGEEQHDAAADDAAADAGKSKDAASGKARDAANGKGDKGDKGDELSTLEKIKRQTKEGDEAPSSTLRFRDVLGGEFLLALVRRQAWLIVLVVFFVILYVAMRYQCQQDAIDIAQLEKSLTNAKFEALSSSSNLTRLCRQSNVQRMLNEADSIPLHVGSQPPYIIEVPEE